MPNATTPSPITSASAPFVQRWIDIWGSGAQRPTAPLGTFDGVLDVWWKAWEESMAMWAPGGALRTRQAVPTGHQPGSAAVTRRPRQYPPGRPIGQLAVGQSASFAKVVTQAEIDAFAECTGDDNPVHIDEEWAAASIFKGRISHGLLTAGLISATIGTQLPGPGTVYVSQTLRWTAPVRSGDVLTCTVTVKELIPEKNRAILTTVVACDGREVLTGEALVMPPKAPS